MIKFLQDVFVPLTSLCVGDAYLKYVASAYLFGTLPEKGEDALHAARRDIVSNKALFSGAISVGLPAFMRIKSFLPRVWQPTLPPQFDLNSEGNDTSAVDSTECPQKPKKGKRKKQKDEQGIQWIGDKVGFSSSNISI